MRIAPVPLPEPPERLTLEPFASAFTQIVVPEALRGNWFEARKAPTASTLAQISRRIINHLRTQAGHEFHPAIFVHALLVCCHFYSIAMEDAGDHAEMLEPQQDALDAAFSLIQHLMLHHDLHDLYVRLC